MGGKRKRIGAKKKYMKTLIAKKNISKKKIKGLDFINIYRN